MSIHSKENIRKIVKLSPREFPQPSPKSGKYLYAKYMAYKVLRISCICQIRWKHTSLIIVFLQVPLWELLKGTVT